MRVRAAAILLLVHFTILLGISHATAQTELENQNAASQVSASQGQPFHLSPEQYSRSKSYSNARYTHYFVGQAYAFLALLALLYLKLGPRLQGCVENITSKRWLQTIIFAPLFIFIFSALILPTDIWDHALGMRYGLSIESWGPWFSDWLKSEALSLMVGTLLIWILYAVIRRSPGRWWFYFWLSSFPIVVLAIFVAPVVVDPLFFKFEPLLPKNPQLVDQIEKVVRRAGMDIPPDRMFEMNASTKYTGLNAFVEGFGSTKRVVVWDTMLQKSSVPEIMVVFGHEMGHYVLLHIPKQTAIGEAVVLVLLFVGFRIVRWQLSARPFGIGDESELASLPLLLLVFGVLAFLSNPIFAGVSQHFEHEADRYALEVTHDIIADAGQAGVRFFQVSGITNLADPDPNPFIVFWLFDHPSDPARIEFMRTYDPWSKGRSPKYVK